MEHQIELTAQHRPEVLERILRVIVSLLHVAMA